MNAIRTVLTIIATVLTGSLMFGPQVLGCTVNAVSQAWNCSASWLPPAWAGGIAVAALIGNLVLKGLTGAGFLPSLFNKTAVVSASGKPNTVSPEQVVPK